jgi:hypothetical protein
MIEEKSYKQIGCCTRKVLIEKHISMEQKLKWVIFKKEEAIKQKRNERAIERWEILAEYYLSYPEKFERMVNTIRNEVK